MVPPTQDSSKQRKGSTSSSGYGTGPGSNQNSINNSGTESMGPPAQIPSRVVISRAERASLTRVDEGAPPATGDAVVADEGRRFVEETLSSFDATGSTVHTDTNTTQTGGFLSQSSVEMNNGRIPEPGRPIKIFDRTGLGNTIFHHRFKSSLRY